MTSIGKTFTLGVTAPIAAAGGAAFKMAADLQDAMGAADQIFKDSAGEVKGWASELETYYGIAEGEAISYANTMGAMLQNIGGLTEKEASKQSQTLVQLAGDLSAMFGGTTESAVQALTGALKGNNAMLDNYGMGVNDATIKAKAMEMGLISEGETLDLASKQAATLALIMEQTADAQGQAARESDGASGSMKSLMTELKNLATSIGGILLPIITPMITKVKEMVEKFSSLDEETKKNIVTALLLAAAIGPVMMVLGSLTSGIGSALMMVNKFSTALTAGKTILSALGVALGPAGLIMLGLMALAAAAFLIIKNWDKITEFFTGLKETLSSVFTDIKNNVLGIWDDIVSGVKGAVNKIISAMNGMIKGMNKIKFDFPKWVPGLGGKSFGMNIPQIPMLAEGGIVNRPTLAMIGEAGPEKVVPLNKDHSGMNVTINVRSPYDVAKELSILDKKLAWGL